MQDALCKELEQSNQLLASQNASLKESLSGAPTISTAEYESVLMKMSGLEELTREQESLIDQLEARYEAEKGVILAEKRQLEDQLHAKEAELEALQEDLAVLQEYQSVDPPSSKLRSLWTSTRAPSSPRLQHRRQYPLQSCERSSRGWSRKSKRCRASWQPKTAPWLS